MTDVPPDALELFDRGQKQESAKRRRSWANPMAIRIPLWDPGRFLDRHVPLWRCCGAAPGAALAGRGAAGAGAAAAHWPELTGNLADRVLQADNLLLMVLVFPLIKALHEMGHATPTTPPAARCTTWA
jgi:putative peptide zinc metalloprotease protein